MFTAPAMVRLVEVESTISELHELVSLLITVEPHALIKFLKFIIELQAENHLTFAGLSSSNRGCTRQWNESKFICLSRGKGTCELDPYFT